MAKTFHSDGNQGTGVPGSIITATFLNRLNNPQFSGIPVDGQIPAFNFGGTVAIPGNGALQLDPTPGNHFRLTGAAPVNSITVPNSLGGTHVVLEFTGGGGIAHDGTSGSILCPRGVSVQTEAGSVVLLSEYAPGKWIVIATNNELLFNGAAANPPLKGIGGGGVFFLTDGGVGFSAGGNEGMRLTGARNLLIGAATDNGVHKLQIAGGLLCAPGAVRTNALDVADASNTVTAGIRAKYTAGVGATNTQITSEGGNGSVTIVMGTNGAGKAFTDIITNAESASGTGGNTCNVANSAIYGAPGARNYIYSYGYLTCSVASGGPYAIRTLTFTY
ncbi:MAG: hypothetical protein HY243_12390 [Proteobacteria bacterium]|nr:hypothetical protein [Pseudomonadota bacterium]